MSRGMKGAPGGRGGRHAGSTNGASRAERDEPLQRGGARASAILVDEENECGARTRPGARSAATAAVEQELGLQAILEGDDLDQALTYARERLRPRLERLAGASHTALYQALQLVAEIEAALRDAPMGRRGAVLSELGCSVKEKNVALSLINHFFKLPTEGLGESARKKEQNRRSTYAAAIEGAALAGIKPCELAEQCRQWGGVEGLAEVARAHRRSKPSETTPSVEEEDDGWDDDEPVKWLGLGSKAGASEVQRPSNVTVSKRSGPGRKAPPVEDASVRQFTLAPEIQRQFDRSAGWKLCVIDVDADPPAVVACTRVPQAEPEAAPALVADIYRAYRAAAGAASKRLDPMDRPQLGRGGRDRDA